MYYCTNQSLYVWRLISRASYGFAGMQIIADGNSSNHQVTYLYWDHLRVENMASVPVTLPYVKILNSDPFQP